MADISRRLFLGRTAVGAVAAPQILARASTQLSAGIVGKSALLAEAGNVCPQIPAMVTNPLQRAAEQAYNLAQANSEKADRYRIDGLSPDIWALHSTSPTYRLAIQRRRDEARRSTLAVLYKKVADLRGW